MLIGYGLFLKKHCKMVMRTIGMRKYMIICVYALYADMKKAIRKRKIFDANVIF